MIAIHIGAAKAGSTTIQRFLAGNADALRHIGVDYPRIGQTRRGWHNNLVYELRKHRNFDSKYGTISQLLDHVRTKEFKVTVLSAEEFGDCMPNQVAELKRRLDEVGRDIKIIFIIRDLIELMPSAYAQATKGGENVLDFDSFFLARRRRRGKVFLNTCRVWANCFGWDRLRVRVLDRTLLVNGDLADDFLTVLGVDPKGCDFQRSETISVANASPGWRVLEAVRALHAGRHGLPTGHPLNQSLPHDHDTKKLIGRLARILGGKLGWNADRGRYLSHSQAQRCVEMHAQTIATLNQVLPEGLPQPLDLSERGFIEREFMPEASQIPAQELSGFYDSLAALLSQRRPTALSA